MPDSTRPLPLEIDCRAVKTLLDAGGEMVLVDCRERQEHGLAHIAGATLLPMSELIARRGELERYRARRIVVHCHQGVRSAQVAAWLREQGYPNAQSMAGGIDRWSIEIDPSVPRYL